MHNLSDNKTFEEIRKQLNEEVAALFNEAYAFRKNTIAEREELVKKVDGELLISTAMVQDLFDANCDDLMKLYDVGGGTFGDTYEYNGHDIPTTVYYVKVDSKFPFLSAGKIYESSNRIHYGKESARRLFLEQNIQEKIAIFKRIVEICYGDPEVVLKETKESIERAKAYLEHRTQLLEELKEKREQILPLTKKLFHKKEGKIKLKEVDDKIKICESDISNCENNLKKLEEEIKERLAQREEFIQSINPQLLKRIKAVVDDYQKADDAVQAIETEKDFNSRLYHATKEMGFNVYGSNNDELYVTTRKLNEFLGRIITEGHIQELSEDKITSSLLKLSTDKNRNYKDENEQDHGEYLEYYLSEKLKKLAVSEKV